MNNSVMIKANNYGIIVVFDPELPFEQIKKDLADKFSSSSKFLGNAQMALSLEGRELSHDEQREVLRIISENCSLQIMCLVDHDKEKEEHFKQTLNDKLMSLDQKTGQFYKGNLRSGQVAEFETSVVVMGDVNPGAKVISKGNIVILGALKGNVSAGATGNENSFVVAMEMSPVQIRIADIIARAPDKPDETAEKGPKIAFIEDGNIYIEPLSRNVLNDIHLF